MGVMDMSKFGCERCKSDISMRAKFDTYLKYILVGFSKVKSLEQPVKLFPESMKEKVVLAFRQISIKKPSVQ